MTTAPDDLERQIATLRRRLDDEDDPDIRDAIAAKLDKLCARLDQISRGQATVHGDNLGQMVGINMGTMQLFFGTPTPSEDKATLLAAYLTSMVSEWQQLRLGRLVEQPQTGCDQPTLPTLTLQAVYTGLTTTGEPVLLHERAYPAGSMRRLYGRLRARSAADVPPDQVRDLTVDGCTPSDDRVVGRLGTLRETRIDDDLPDETPLRLRITRPELATEAIRTTHRLVLVGEPGSGKSTVLRYLALLLAVRMQHPSAGLPLGWDGSFLPVPILCPLGAIAERLSPTIPASQALWQAIERALDDAQGSRAGLRIHLTDAIRRGGVLLLFDGLDELPTSGDNPRQQVAQALAAFAVQTAPRTPIVITSRVKAYQESPAGQLPADEGWQVRQIHPLTFGQVQQFVQQWYAELAQTLDEPATQRA